MYIIVWRNSHREPHLDLTTHGFRELYSTYEEAKASAEETQKAEGEKSPWYFDYQIYKEANG